MTGQLTFQTIGGETVTVRPRGKHYIEPRGGTDRPGTGPDGETCGSCKHIARGRRFAKCELNRACWTHSRRSDILVGWAACSKWEKPL